MYEFEGKWVDPERTYRIWIAHFGASLGSLAAWTALLDYQSNQIRNLQHGRRRRFWHRCRLPSSISRLRSLFFQQAHPAAHPPENRQARRSKSQNTRFQSHPTYPASTPHTLQRLLDPRLPAAKRKSDPNTPPLPTMGVLRHPRRLRPRPHDMRTLPIPEIPPLAPRIHLQPDPGAAREIQLADPAHNG